MPTHLDFGSDPLQHFLQWYDDALKAQVPMPDAMTLATATPSGIPSARIVLYKGMNKKGVRFFTNYLSRKGKELKANPRAALVFYWPALNRQIRIEGKIEKLPKSESDAYWNSRPRESCLGALASPQSSPIPEREFLEQRMTELDDQFKGKTIPRPSHWGGFCLIPHKIEFWLAGSYRLHDRFCYSRKKEKWERVQLAP